MVYKKKTDETTDDGIMQMPRSLSLKDLITIASVCVSLTLAWGVFGTRITVLEKEVIALKEAATANTASIETLKSQVRKLEIRQQDDQQFIDDIYRGMKKNLPRRTADF